MFVFFYDPNRTGWRVLISLFISFSIHRAVFFSPEHMFVFFYGPNRAGVASVEISIYILFHPSSRFLFTGTIVCLFLGPKSKGVASVEVSIYFLFPSIEPFSFHRNNCLSFFMTQIELGWRVFKFPLSFFPRSQKNSHKIIRPLKRNRIFINLFSLSYLFLA